MGCNASVNVLEEQNLIRYTNYDEKQEKKSRNLFIKNSK